MSSIKSKEKANELYAKMYANCTMTIAGAGSIWKPLVKKQCGIVCDEVIEVLPDFDLGIDPYACKEFYQEVKEEIEKL